MFSYYIKENGHIIGWARGKYRAFKMINARLGGKIGLWFGDRCILKDQNVEYKIEKAEA